MKCDSWKKNESLSMKQDSWRINNVDMLGKFSIISYTFSKIVLLSLGLGHLLLGIYSKDP